MRMFKPKPKSTESVGPAGVAVTIGSDIQAAFDRDAPWYTSGAIAHLDNMDLSNLVGLEYGGGGSSLWWAARLRTLYTVEANVKWALAIAHHFRSQPELLVRWRLTLVPANWHRRSDGSLDLKNEWQRDPSLITPDRALDLEAAYLRPPVDDADVVMIDGAIRQETVTRFADWVHGRRVSVIVVDNTESQRTSRLCSEAFTDFERLDFPEEKPELIPPHQQSWTTSIFARNRS